MIIQSRDAKGKFNEQVGIRLVVQGDLAQDFSLEVTEGRSVHDLSPEVTMFLRVRGLEIRVRADGTVNVSNIETIAVTSPISICGRH